MVVEEELEWCRSLEVQCRWSEEGGREGFGHGYAVWNTLQQKRNKNKIKNIEVRWEQVVVPLAVLVQACCCCCAMQPAPSEIVGSVPGRSLSLTHTYTNTHHAPHLSIHTHTRARAPSTRIA